MELNDQVGVWNLQWWEEVEDYRSGSERYAELLANHNREPTSGREAGLLQAYRHPDMGATPRFFTRTDGAKLVYEGKSHSFVGEAESLKSWAAQALACEVARSGIGVIFVDCESDVNSVARRFKAMRLGQAIQNVAYVRLEDPLVYRNGSPTDAFFDLDLVGRAWRAKLMIVDGVTEMMATHNWDINEAADVARYQKLLLRRWPGQLTTVEIDHVAKGDFNGGGKSALGSQHKRAGIDGASYLFTPALKGGEGGRSTAEITLLKDREGKIRSQCLRSDGYLGTFILDSTESVTRTSIDIDTVDPLFGVEDLVLAALEEKPRGTKRLVEDLKIGVGEKRMRELLIGLEVEGKIMRGEGNGPWMSVPEHEEDSE